MNGGLSVIISNYNHARYIGDALEAILTQSLKPSEVIVVDDASTDDSMAVIEGHARRHPIIQVCRNERNSGFSHSTNKALSLASGDFVYLAGADDQALPGLFEKSLALLRRHQTAGLCSADIRCLDDATGNVRETPYRLAPEPTYLSPERFRALVRRRFYPPSTQATIWRRSAFLDAGGYRTELRWAADWFAYAVVGFRHGICHIPEPLGQFRVSEGSLSVLGHRQGHADVVQSVLSLLETRQYDDVRRCFQQTSILSCCPDRVLTALLRHRRGWRYLSAPLLAHGLWERTKRTLKPFTPETVKRWYRDARYGRA